MENTITRESVIYTEIVSKLRVMEKNVDSMLSAGLSGPDKWIGGEEVMRILGISKRTLQNYRNNGTLPYSVVVGKIYYQKTDLDELLKANYVKPNTVNRRF